MKATGRPLTIEPGMNGGVEIIGWNKDSIAVTARIQVNARSREDADAIARDIKIEASGGTVRATGGSGPFGRRQNWSVSFLVMVPRRTDLTLSTQNGPLSVQDVAGRMDLQTQNGPLSLSGVGGDVHASAQNGPLTIELLGTRWEGVGLDAETQNGPADLQIPDNYNAKIEFGTARDGRASVRVFDIRGRLVATVVDRKLPTGNHEFDFDAGHLSSGVYLMVLQAEGRPREVRRISILK